MSSLLVTSMAGNAVLNATSACDAASHVWIPELLERIVSFLPSNVVPCTIRLVNKTAAAQFTSRKCTTVMLSLPTPQHAFDHHWRTSGAMRSLTLKERRQLLCLTARSGSLPNLETAAASVGCSLTAGVFEAAAAAAQLDVCHWLQQQDCPWGSALAAAAGAGQQALCEQLLCKGCPWSKDAVLAAARDGHVGLMEWLQLRCPDPDHRSPAVSQLLPAVAAGCDLPTLQRLHDEWLREPRSAAGQSLRGPAPPPQLHGTAKLAMLAGAAGSPTPDWRDKVEWLEGRERYPVRFAASACAAMAARRSDAVDRLKWLRERGFPVDHRAIRAAAESGNVAALSYLLDERAQPNEEVAWIAAKAGHLEFLKAMYDRGCCISAHSTMREAAQGGQLRVLVWLVETLEGVREAELSVRGGIWSAAVESGNLQLLGWLWQRGYPWEPNTFSAAAEGGSEEVLEWLAEQDCPMQEDGWPYVLAGRNGDLATVRCLQRLGCPCGPEGGEAFTTAAADSSCSLSVLRLLLEAGCPVDWDAAEKAARQYGEAARTWLELQRKLREPGGPGGQQQKQRGLALSGCLVM